MRELRDDELEKVSGGLDAGKNEVAGSSASATMSPS
jgi:bacteriocin-like protein